MSLRSPQFIFFLQNFILFAFSIPHDPKGPVYIPVDGRATACNHADRQKGLDSGGECGKVDGVYLE